MQSLHGWSIEVEIILTYIIINKNKTAEKKQAKPDCKKNAANTSSAEVNSKKIPIDFSVRISTPSAGTRPAKNTASCVLGQPLGNSTSWTVRPGLSCVHPNGRKYGCQRP